MFAVVQVVRESCTAGLEMCLMIQGSLDKASTYYFHS